MVSGALIATIFAGAGAAMMANRGTRLVGTAAIAVAAAILAAHISIWFSLGVAGLAIGSYVAFGRNTVKPNP
ncbi:MAG: hypothetical protein GC131_06395 [Alphaproteobacteria bacterium]|nr:hypothetical protein [Alphaproteobacteria bacterium]